MSDQAEHARSMAGLVEVCFRMQLRVESGKESVAIGQAFASDVIAACKAGEARAQLLADRINCAIAALDEAPDADPAKATRAEVAATHAANLKAWAILSNGRDPPSRGAKP